MRAWAGASGFLNIPGSTVPKKLITASTSAASQATAYQDVACPFCALHCDDLDVRSVGGTVTPTANACARALVSYAEANRCGEPRIRGETASFETAFAHAAQLLRHSHRPLFAGLATDVAGLRAALALAERSRASLEFLHDAATAVNLRVLQTRGWHTTTLSEVRNRADLVVLCGVDLNVNFQNFVPRILAPVHALQQARRDTRRLVYVGPAGQAPADSAGLPLDTLPTRLADLTETLRTLQGLLAGRPLTLRAGRRRQALQALAARVLAAEYPVFVWAPGQLDPRDGDLVVAAVCEIVADLNRTRRAAGLALGGDDGGQTALAVSTWLTGFPLGASFAGDRLEGRAANAGAAREATRDAADLVLFISSFSRREPPRTDVPVIALAPPGFAPGADVEVFLPIGVPGIDHAGQIMRTDGVVALPLRPLRAGGPPSAAALLRRLSDALA